MGGGTSDTADEKSIWRVQCWIKGKTTGEARICSNDSNIESSFWTRKTTCLSESWFLHFSIKSQTQHCFFRPMFYWEPHQTVALPSNWNTSQSGQKTEAIPGGTHLATPAQSPARNESIVSSSGWLVVQCLRVSRSPNFTSSITTQLLLKVSRQFLIMAEGLAKHASTTCKRSQFGCVIVQFRQRCLGKDYLKMANCFQPLNDASSTG